MSQQNQEPGSEIILYQTEGGNTRLEVKLENNTVWLTQKQMAELFQTTIPNVNMHLRNVYAEGELQAEATLKEFLIVRPEGNRQVSRAVEHYNLDAIIAVGYRVNSREATQFRIWATQVLREYLIKGFVLDDERLKHGKRLSKDYLDELDLRPLRQPLVASGCSTTVLVLYWAQQPHRWSDL